MAIYLCLLRCSRYRTQNKRAIPTSTTSVTMKNIQNSILLVPFGGAEHCFIFVDPVARDRRNLFFLLDDDDTSSPVHVPYVVRMCYLVVYQEKARRNHPVTHTHTHTLSLSLCETGRRTVLKKKIAA